MKKSLLPLLLTFILGCGSPTEEKHVEQIQQIDLSKAEAAAKAEHEDHDRKIQEAARHEEEVRKQRELDQLRAQNEMRQKEESARQEEERQRQSALLKHQQDQERADAEAALKIRQEAEAKIAEQTRLMEEQRKQNEAIAAKKKSGIILGGQILEDKAAQDIIAKGITIDPDTLEDADVAVRALSRISKSLDNGRYDQFVEGLQEEWTPVQRFLNLPFVKSLDDDSDGSKILRPLYYHIKDGGDFFWHFQATWKEYRDAHKENDFIEKKDWLSKRDSEIEGAKSILDSLMKIPTARIGSTTLPVPARKPIRADSRAIAIYVMKDGTQFDALSSVDTDDSYVIKTDTGMKVLKKSDVSEVQKVNK